MLGRLLVSLHLLLLALSIVQTVSSAPLTSRADDVTVDGPSVLSSSNIEGFKPYAYLAGAGYCPLSSWNCGSFCDGAPGFQLTATGGDGGKQPYWYVGFAPSLGQIIVGHQGTNSSNVMSILNNIDLIRKSLPQTYYPGVSSSVSVHSGFLSTALSSASSVLAAVNGLVQSTGSKQVAIVGHSLGAATATLHGVYLKLNLQSDISVKIVGFAAPRVGCFIGGKYVDLMRLTPYYRNAAFASLTDTTITDLTHINNKEDPVPTLPGRFLGYAHPNGEVHISTDGPWYSCPGHDSTVANCTIAAVPNIFLSDVNDHYGPYAGVYLGSSYCK